MWAQVTNAALGIWLMIAPAILTYGDPAQNNDRIFGPVIATFAIISWWEATRNVRWANFLPGAWLLLAPWVLGYDATAPVVNSMIVGVLVIGLSLVRGTVEQRYGGGWRSLLKSDTLHEREARKQYRTS